MPFERANQKDKFDTGGRGGAYRRGHLILKIETAMQSCQSCRLSHEGGKDERPVA